MKKHKPTTMYCYCKECEKVYRVPQAKVKKSWRYNPLAD
jgi:hypothetical protein